MAQGPRGWGLRVHFFVREQLHLVLRGSLQPALGGSLQLALRGSQQLALGGWLLAVASLLGEGLG